MKKIGILYNPIKEKLKERADELADLIKDKYKVWIQTTGKEEKDWEPIDSDSDLIIVFGGDGTFLNTARNVCKYEIPILGINHGHLGFLSESADIDLEELAEYINHENIIIEDRDMLQGYLPELDISFHALNDIVINRSHLANLLYTDLYVGEDLLSSFRSDGLIVCTPTGSTAYALSAGGAVMDPGIQAFQIVPIAPHSLTSRPHVISNDQTIVIHSRDEIKFFMQADGQELIELKPGSKIIVQKSPYKLKLAGLKGKKLSFYNILRDKFLWGSVNA